MRCLIVCTSLSTKDNSRILFSYSFHIQIRNFDSTSTTTSFLINLSPMTWISRWNWDFLFFISKIQFNCCEKDFVLHVSQSLQERKSDLRGDHQQICRETRESQSRSEPIENDNGWSHPSSIFNLKWFFEGQHGEKKNYYYFNQG